MNEKVTIEMARDILTSTKIVTFEEAIKVWDITVNEKDGTQFVGYSLETLNKCADENEKNREDWRLVYSIGLSIQEMYQKREDCFGNGGITLSKIDESWIRSRGRSGYSLINFNSVFGKKPISGYSNAAYMMQESHLLMGEAKKENSRCNLNTLTEALIVIMCNSEEILVNDWYHVSSSITTSCCNKGCYIHVRCYKYEYGGIDFCSEDSNIKRTGVALYKPRP
jgi:hypothetical protein